MFHYLKRGLVQVRKGENSQVLRKEQTLRAKFLYNSIRLVILLFVTVILTGCLKPIPTENMIPTQIGNEYLIYSGLLYRSISVSKVGGGKETNPVMFSEIGNPELEKAIIKSLESNNYYASTTEDAKYTLNVFLVEIDRPKGGFTTTITTFVRYKLTDDKNNKVVLDEIVKTSDTKTVGEVFSGVSRMRITQEESIKKNIAQFIKIIFSLNEKNSTKN